MAEAPNPNPHNGQQEYEVIATFRDIEESQRIFTIMRPVGDSEESFVRAVLSDLKETGIWPVHRLWKLSIAHQQYDGDEAEPWLLPRWGKFIFDIQIVDSPDARRWAAFRDDFMREQ